MRALHHIVAALLLVAGTASILWLPTQHGAPLFFICSLLAVSVYARRGVNRRRLQNDCDAIMRAGIRGAFRGRDD